MPWRKRSTVVASMIRLYPPSKKETDLTVFFKGPQYSAATHLRGTMSELILHHFDLSPFAEKVRLMLGLKGLAWRSVQIPMVMPKPDLTALTGGYRKTPVLQIGADMYCDTRLIAAELEARHPAPTLFPAGNRGMSLALSAWSDRAFFEPGAGLSMGLNKRGLPEAVINDRKAFFNFMNFDTLEHDVPSPDHAASRSRRLDRTTTRGRAAISLRRYGGSRGYQCLFPGMDGARQCADGRRDFLALHAPRRVGIANARDRTWPAQRNDCGAGSRPGAQLRLPVRAAVSIRRMHSVYPRARRSR